MSAVLEAQETGARYSEVVQPALVRRFELLATARGGIPRLRALLLALAVQGKLVPQDSSEGHASGLLAQLKARRPESVRGGAGDVASREDVEFPCELPAGWVWVQLSDLGQFCGGKTPSKQHTAYWSGSIPWITPKDMKQLCLLDSEDHVSQAAIEDGLALVPPNSLLVVVRSGILRRTVPTAVNLVQTTINQDLKALKLSMPEMARYVQLLIRGFERFILETLTKIGTTVESIRFDEFAAQPFPLPPLAEQGRIMARVDELMRLCDALEAKERLEAEQHARLVDTLLRTLTDSSTPEALAANWRPVADHFDLLFDRPEAVDALEKSILQLAVRGLLVPQAPSEEPASDLVRRIRSYREEQVKAGLAKREKPFTPLSGTDLPFELPTGWEWVRFDELIEPAKPISYGVLVPGPEVSGGVPFVRIADLSLTDPPAQPEKSISSEVDAQYQRTRLEGGEILMGVVGSIGKLGVAPPSWAGANIARAICRIVPVGLVDKDFVLLLLQSEFMRDSFAGDTRTLAQPTLNVGLIRGSATPLPPIAEQTRIVARVTELRRLCANLRHRFDRSSAMQALLADALIDQALAA